jgi:predicted permease
MRKGEHEALHARKPGQGEVDLEVEEELRFHLQAREEELLRAGWSRQEAAREARRRFGDLAAVRIRSRALRAQAVRRRRWREARDGLGQDVRLAWRELARDRGISALVVTTLALGAGFATALFSLVDTVLLRPLPYPEPDRLVYLWQNDRATGTLREPAGTADFYDFRDRTRSFSAVGMFLPGSGTLLSPGGEARSLRLAAVHHDLPGVLGIEPALGRMISREETEGGGAEVVLLTDPLWRGLFSGDPSVVGRTVVLDDVPREVVGILPPGAGMVMGAAVDAWIPLRVSPAQATRSPHQVTVVARLASGVGLPGAAAEMAALAARMEEEDPENRNRGAFVEPVADYLRGPSGATLVLLQGAVGLLLLLMTLNVTHLLLSRGVARSRDAAVHLALGAGAGRVARRAMLSTFLLCLAGTGVGLGVALLLLDLLAPLVPPAMRPTSPVGLDARVLLFAFVLAVGLAAASGIPPALAAFRLDLQRALSVARGEAGGRGPRDRARYLLVAAQAGVASILVVGASLLGSTLLNLHRVDPGFGVDRTLRLTLSLPSTRYPADFSRFPDWPERLELQAELLRRGREVPGVEALALAVNHPLDPGFTNSFRIEGRAPDPGQGEMTTRMVTPGYFPVTGLALVEGRLFHEGEGPDDPGTVVINRAAARLHFPDGGAVGSRIAFWGLQFREIVGVVEDERVHGIREAAPPAFYVNLLQTPSAAGELTLLARTAGDPEASAAPLQRLVAAVDPGLAVHDVATMEATLARSLQRERFATGVVGLFAAMALGLSALGVYGVLSYSVARRRREMGVRMALGARATELRWSVVRQGLGWVAAGAGLGLLAARGASGVLDALLYEVNPGSPWAYFLAVTVLLGVAVLAALVPAGRISRIDPAASLRAD